MNPPEKIPKGHTSASLPNNEGNPALRLMGLPKLRAKLPSRNWLIFFAITGSFMAAIMYDRKQKRKVQQKWCNAVSHLAEQSLPPQQMPRHITVFLEAPPGDYLLAAREYFAEYVKPILVAAAVDWEVVEGRKEGEIQQKFAAKIREQRHRAGELYPATTALSSDASDDAISFLRHKSGVHDSDEIGGSLIVGRHTWKEYVRGLHEGWLGPMEPPPNPANKASSTIVTAKNADANQSQEPNEDTHSSSQEKAGASKEDQNDKKIVAPVVTPLNYRMCQLPASIPKVFEPAVAVDFPHLLGFLNTPERIWRFLNRRTVAERTGAAVAAFVLSDRTQIRRFRSEPTTTHGLQGSLTVHADDEAASSVSQAEQPRYRSEITSVLEAEEHDWHKSAKKATAEGEDFRERPWKEEVFVDERISERMRTMSILPVAKEADSDAHVFQPLWEPANSAGKAVVKSTGSILAASSSGSRTAELQRESTNKGVDWKGSADPRVTMTWGQWLYQSMTKNTRDNLPPWEQGLENDG